MNDNINARVVDIEPLLVDTHAATKLLSISRSTLYLLIEAGKIKSITVRGRRLFSVKDLKRIAEEGA